jgi:hypothetical protein
MIGPISKRICWLTSIASDRSWMPKMAVRQVLWHITQRGRREVVDADLRDYFTTIPHGPLMRCLTRRIADGRLLCVIKGWLTVPVVERVGRRAIRTATARKTKRGRHKAR